MFNNIEETLRTYDKLLREKQRAAAATFLEEQLSQAEAAGDTRACISFCNELVGFYRVEGRQEQSFSAAERVLNLLKESGHSGDIPYATALLNYATAKSAFRQVEEAMPLYRQVETIYLEQLPEIDYRQASLLNNMGQSLLFLQRRQEARDCFRRSMEILQQLGGLTAEKATCNLHLACCDLEEGLLDAAETHLRQADAGFASLGADDPHSKGCLHAWARLKQMQGDPEAACDYLRRARGVQA